MAGVTRSCELLVAYAREHGQPRCCDAKGAAPCMGQIDICELGEYLREGATYFCEDILGKFCAIAFAAAKDQPIVMAQVVVIQHKTVVGYGNVFG